MKVLGAGLVVVGVAGLALAGLMYANHQVNGNPDWDGLVLEATVLEAIAFGGLAVAGAVIVVACC